MKALIHAQSNFMAKAMCSAVAVVVLTLMASPAAKAAGVSGQGSWETTLQGRDLDGNLANGFEAYYDTDLNITWLADASAFYGTWDAAKAWAASLNVNGITGWRLPNVKPVNGNAFNFDTGYDGSTDSGYGITSSQSELAHLYYLTLGNKAYVDTTGRRVQPDAGLTNTGPFKNVPARRYWFGVEYPDYYSAFVFDTSVGSQGHCYKGCEFPAWAVHAGDVAAAVPESETCALALAGLVALAIKRGRRHR